MIKKVSIAFALCFMAFIFSGYSKPDVYVIDAAKNAIAHNNNGLEAASIENYDVAISEFMLAISLNPRTQATAVYYNNLGETYMKIGCYSQAQRCFENAMTQYNLNFLYYQNLVKSFKAQKTVKKQLQIYKAKSENNDLSMIVLGLLYIANGQKGAGITKLDEFCMRDPDLLITSAVKNYLSQISP